MTPLPERAADTSAEQPWPVRLLSAKIGEYVDMLARGETLVPNGKARTK